MGSTMRIAIERIELSCPEAEIYNRLLALDDAHILELGCGTAMHTRDIASAGSGRHVTALEVDEIAHGNNMQISDLPNVTFVLAGAEAIPLSDASVDIVLMFKSLHHVPVEEMDRAMQEIKRVLRPGGLAYISEPIFAGEFNEILRLFHDESRVRQAAFDAVSKAVDEGHFDLAEEVFFNSPMAFENFADFEDKILNATHTRHNLTEDVYAQVQQRFAANLDADGARFLMPMRVDLLRRPS